MLDLGCAEGAEAILIALLAESCEVKAVGTRRNGLIAAPVLRGRRSQAAPLRQSGWRDRRTGWGPSCRPRRHPWTKSPHRRRPPRRRWWQWLPWPLRPPARAPSETLKRTTPGGPALPRPVLGSGGCSCCGRDRLGPEGRGRIEAPVSPRRASEAILEEHS